MSVKPSPYEYIFCGKFLATIFICSCTENLPEFYVTYAFADKLACQFLCGKEKMSYVEVCLCTRPVSENLPHTQRLAVASVLSLLSIVISGAQANEFST